MMAAPPPLLSVSSSLAAPFQALPHVLDLVSSYLLPTTLDSAVFSELHRVVHRYRRSRPFTVGAMDGAAALGKLELVHWLRSNRPEGCSGAAFNSAAANRHLNVLEWLYEFYPQVANPAEEIVKAAECGHVEVIRFLRPKVRREQMASALEAAAANGHVPVLATLLERPYSVRTSLLAAAGNGQTQVVQYLLERGYRDKYTYVNPALVKAAGVGHCDVVELLVDKSDEYTIIEALMTAATDGRESVVKFLLEKCKLEKVAVARALEKAAEHEQCEVVKLLLGDFAREGENRSGGTTDSMVRNVRSGNSIIDLAFISAVEKGRSHLVKLLIAAFSRPMSDALIAAGSSYQLEVLEFILDYCAARHFEDAHYNESITTIAETAAWSRNVNMAKLLAAKCETLNTGGALRIAVDNEDLEMIRVLVAKSNVISIQDALVTAAVTRREKLLEVLLEYSNADTIEQALIRVESIGNATMSKLLLCKCDPGAYSRIFDNAASHGLVGLVRLLLDRMSEHSIRCALISAAISGHTEVVNALVDESDSTGITCAFEMAVLRGQVDVVELLRSRCDTESIKFAMSAGDAGVVRLLRNKRARFE